MKKEKSSWRIPVLLLTFVIPLFLNSFSQPLDTQQTSKTDSRKECMLDILESLEGGENYVKGESWGESKFVIFDIHEVAIPDFSDFEFDIDFPELTFDNYNIEELEKRMEDMANRIEAKMEEMIKRFESVQHKYEKRL